MFMTPAQAAENRERHRRAREKNEDDKHEADVLNHLQADRELEASQNTALQAVRQRIHFNLDQVEEKRVGHIYTATYLIPYYSAMQAPMIQTDFVFLIYLVIFLSYHPMIRALRGARWAEVHSLYSR